MCLADNVSCCPIETFPKYLGDIKIAGRSLVAEVNSDNRAKRLRAEIEKRLGASAVHQTTSAKTAEEMLAKAPKRKSASEDDVIEQALLHDPEARGRFEQIIQKQAEDWVRRKVPALGGRTPLQAVQDPDGREIVESLLLDWERSGAYQAGIRPDLDAVRKLLSLMPSTP